MAKRSYPSNTPANESNQARFEGRAYMRGALTSYRSTVQQIDAALPSTFVVGSIGAGGNWNDWVVDGFASYGRQDYGLVETPSQIADGSDYLALGLRAGRIFHPSSKIPWLLGKLFPPRDPCAATCFCGRAG